MSEVIMTIKFIEKLNEKETDEYKDLQSKYFKSCYEQLKAEHLLFVYEYERKHLMHKDISKADFKNIKDMHIAKSGNLLIHIEAYRKDKESEVA